MFQGLFNDNWTGAMIVAEFGVTMQVIQESIAFLCRSQDDWIRTHLTQLVDAMERDWDEGQGMIFNDLPGGRIYSVSGFMMVRGEVEKRGYNPNSTFKLGKMVKK